jgi:hypothetical protein
MNVRGDYTKDKAGTLPLYMYSNSQFQTHNHTTFYFDSYSPPVSLYFHKFQVQIYRQQDFSPWNFEIHDDKSVKVKVTDTLKVVTHIDLEEGSEITIDEELYIEICGICREEEDI